MASTYPNGHSPSPSGISTKPLAPTFEMAAMPKMPKANVVVQEKEISKPYSSRNQSSSDDKRMDDYFTNQMEKEAQPRVAAFFSRLFENDIIRYTLYIIPVAIIIAIPLTLYCTIWKHVAWSVHVTTNTTTITRANGTTFTAGSIINGTVTSGVFVNGNLVNGTVTGSVIQASTLVQLHKKGVLVWVELCWAFLWIAKILATIIPYVFAWISGQITTGLRKYALVLQAVKTPLSIFIWSVLCLASYNIIYVFDQTTHAKYNGKNNPIPGMATFHKVLKVSTGMAALWLAEKMLVQLVSVSYHAKANHDRIKEIKKTSKAIDLLYEASLRRFPDYHKDFVEEDIDIHDSSNVQKILRNNSADKRTRRFFGKLRWTADQVTTAFGRIASDITGQEVLMPTATHAVVEGALERSAGCEALARRIFKALCPAGADGISEQNLIEEFGSGRELEAGWIYSQLDRDDNPDVTLDEMIFLIRSIAQQRKDMWRSACDIKDAIKILDNVLSFIVFVIVCLFYAAFFSTVLSTKGSTIWSFFAGGAFAIANTVGEFNAACIFIFVKHPYDIGDRINMNGVEYDVVKISLLYSVFKRIDNDTIVSVGNQVLAGVWIENVSRSNAMKERLQFSVSASTSFDDIELLRVELEKFVRDPEHSRHFRPNVDIQLISVGDLKQLDLRVEILHKSNWAVEQLRAERRSRFMCALLSAMRKVPIDGPGGSGPAAGSINNPNYSVEVSQDTANTARAKFDADKDAKKLVNQPDFATDSGVSSGLEILKTLTRRSLIDTDGRSQLQNPFLAPQPANADSINRDRGSFDTSVSITRSPHGDSALRPHGSNLV